MPLLRLLLACVLCILPSLLWADGRWDGQWQTFWRDGQALMTVEQTGNSLQGAFEPQGGRIEGQVDGNVLRGTWSIDGRSGGLVFALSEDGQTFTGRYEGGEYWNGRRVRPGEIDTAAEGLNATPRQTLRSIVNAANAAVFDGNAAAMRIYEPLLAFEGENLGSRDRTRRRTLLWHLINMSTFRLYDSSAARDGTEAIFEIGPDGSSASYMLRFERTAGDGSGGWRLIVEPARVLRSAIEEFLADTGHASVAAFEAHRRQGPRETMRRFLVGMHAWSEGGREDVLETLDLTYLPTHLRTIEAPVLADYLKQVIDRAGFVVWQELPSDPTRPVPFVFYEHPLGSVAIESVRNDDGTLDRWVFSNETLQELPALFSAMQDLPPDAAVPSWTPVSDFFGFREAVRQRAPSLLHRAGVLETWQWLAILATLLLAAVLLALTIFIVRRGATWSRRRMRVERSEIDEEAGRDVAVLAWPLGLGAAGMLLTQSFGLIGIVEGSFVFVNKALGLLTAVAVTLLLYRIAGLVGSFLQHRAERTRSFADEIITSLVTGLAKLAIVIGGIIAAADVVQLPYEGVLAGLGVGGVALAFASRETVSNMLGGVLLMTDRPFRRGDLIETDGTLATVVDVGLRSTRLRRLDDGIMIIPNSQLSEKAIVNLGLRRRRRIDVDIALTYDTPRERLDAFVGRLRDVLGQQPGLDASDSHVGLSALTADAITVECRSYFFVPDYAAQVAARNRLLGDIVDLARDLGVTFALPARVLYEAPSETEDAGGQTAGHP